MAELGFFEGQRVELIEGEVIRMSPVGPQHGTAIVVITDVLNRLFRPPQYTVRVQLPLAIGRKSEPEPDLAVVHGGLRDFKAQHPSTASLVIEVAESSLSYDRGTKASLYAKAGVAEYWIVDLIHRRLEVRREPVVMPEKRHGHGYAVRSRHGEDDTVECLLLAGVQVAVRDLLP